MAHSDSPSESLDGATWQRVGKRMNAKHTDAFILVWGSEEDTETACQEIVIRAREAIAGVPSDTRQALKDGTLGFERVLPGADRMYPDTDLPPLPIPEERVNGIRERLPEYVWDREARYRAMGLPGDTVEALSISPRVHLFVRLVDELKINPTLAAVVLCQRTKAFRREGLNPDLLTDDEIFDVFKAYSGGLLAREGILRVLRRVLEMRLQDKRERVTVADVLDAIDLTPLGDEELAARIIAAIDQLDHDRFPTCAKKHRHLMGVLMNDCTGRVDGGRIARLLAEGLDARPGHDASVKVQA